MPFSVSKKVQNPSPFSYMHRWSTLHKNGLRIILPHVEQSHALRQTKRESHGISPLNQ